MLTLCKLYVSEKFRGQTTFSLETNTGKKKPFRCSSQSSNDFVFIEHFP